MKRRRSSLLQAKEDRIPKLLNVVGNDIKPSLSVRNFGVIIYQDPSLKEQVNAINRSCFGHLDLYSQRFLEFFLELHLGLRKILC